MADEMAEALDQLAGAEWQIFLDFVQPLLEQTPVAGARIDAPATWPLSTASPRLAFLLAFRGQADLKRSIFRKHFVQHGGDHPSIAEFRQAQALEAALAGALEWKLALSIIHSTYAEGAWSQMMHVTFDRSRRAALPEDVVQQVMGTPRDYPVYLWELAEARLAAKARKAVKAVSVVAEKEGWFTS